MRSIMLCYNLKGTKKGRKIGMLGSFLGFRVKYVEKEEYSKTIGILTGLKEEVAEEAAVEETSGTDNAKNEEMTDFEEEMIVMLLADNQTLDKLLFQMRKEFAYSDGDRPIYFIHAILCPLSIISAFLKNRKHANNTIDRCSDIMRHVI